MREHVGRTSDGSEVDVLFIDGDHTADGVKSDFELYKDLVWPGDSSPSRHRRRQA
jgi:Methyltransferase domain